MLMGRKMKSAVVPGPFFVPLTHFYCIKLLRAAKLFQAADAKMYFH